MSDRPHWSYSQISKYLKCPLQYYFEYVVRLPRKFTSAGLVLGSAVHEALAAYHRSIQQQKPFLAADAEETLIAAWNQREAKESIQFAANETKANLLDLGTSLVETYRSAPPPQEVVAVETTLLAPIWNSDGEVLEKPMQSVIDLVVREPEGLAVVDFKTSTRAMSDFEAATALQPTVYLNATRQTWEETVDFRYTVLIKTKTPRVQDVPVERTTDDFARLGDLVQAVERGIEAEAFFPNESALNCSSCPYRGPCREWKGPPRRLSETPTVETTRAGNAHRDARQSRMPLPTCP